MGLFSKKKDNNIEMDIQYRLYADKIQSTDFLEDRDFMYKIEDELKYYQKYGGFTEQTFIPTLLRKRINDRVVSYLTDDYERNPLGANGVLFSAEECSRFLEAWKLAEFFREDNTLVKLLNSDGYKSLLEKCGSFQRPEYFYMIYNCYAHKIIDEIEDGDEQAIDEYINDQDSIIYNSSFYDKVNGDQDLFEEIIRMDIELRNDPRRHSVFYRSDTGELKHPKSIKDDYEKYKDTGNLSRELHF